MSAKKVLLVEDDPSDVGLTRRALEQSRVANELVVVEDGQEALDYLFCAGAYAGRDASDLPALVLLDLKLPRVDGYQVLRLMRADPSLRLVPVVILTTSNNPADIEQSLALGASDYVIKPIGLNEFERKLCGILRYWLSVSDVGRGRPS